MVGSSFFEWVQSWDFMAILYSLIAAFVGAALLRWAGAFRQIRRVYKHRLAKRRYRANLAAECGLLPVVGRRKGFMLKEVYVQLDTAPSDLLPEAAGSVDDAMDSRSSYVLVGGPGAGKSTTVKQIMLDQLSNGRTLPVFLRLRDYVGYDTLEQYVSHRLEAAGFENPMNMTRELLHSSSTVCVLDGLDEVRPQLRDRVIQDVNVFYHRYFVSRSQLIVTCRKEAYRHRPLDIPVVREVRPLTDEQIQRFAAKWPLGFPAGKTQDTFWHDLSGTPRILELARSPLLLVGGLMQYAESNRGIPEERFEYLDRVARWLTVEWATAQGHPPDQYRQVYDRLLARLAYYLHKEQRSDMERSEAVELIREWLPGFGRGDVAAEEVIDAIGTRTGILVSDDRNFLVFAQFGLQEYFASLEVVPQVGAEKLATLEPKDWWREVILLAIAQQREPTAILLALFDQAQFMAAAAVAECPTPSTAIQNKAIKVCLAGIDSGNKEAGSAVVPLLRKVEGEIEAQLCSKLEDRVNRGGATASVVGIVLATAGTKAATAILARHPEVWDVCLKEAGYLSASFENLLVNWIAKGTDFQSQKASELIAARLSMDRLRELLRLLPSLAADRAERLSMLILSNLERLQMAPSGPEMGAPLAVAVRCCGFIQNPEKFLRDRITSIVPKQRKGSTVFSRRLLRGHSNVTEEMALVGMCLFMEDFRGKRACEAAISRSLHYSLLWGSRRQQFLLWGIGTAVVAALVLPSSWNVVLVLAGAVFATLLVQAFQKPVLWVRSYFPYSRQGLTRLALTAAAALGGFLSSACSPSWLSDVLTLAAAFLIMAAGFLSTPVRWVVSYARIDPHNLLDYDLQPSETFFSSIFPALLCAYLAALGTMIWIYQASDEFIRRSCVTVAAASLVWTAVATARLFISWHHVARANKKCRDFMSDIV